MLLLSPDDIRGLISMKEAIEVVEEAIREWGQNPRWNFPRRRIHSPANARVSVHQGTVPGLGAAGLMTHCELVRVLPNNIQRYALRGRPVTVLYSAETAELLCILVGELSASDLVANGIETNSVIELRTAATSAVGMKHLARQDASSAGIFGSSGQAMNHLVALCQVRNIREVKVYSPTPDHRQTFADQMSRVLKVKIIPVSDPREACQGVDIIVNTSNANYPVFQGEWLEKGVHVNAFQASNIGLVQSGYIADKRRELDDATVRRTDLYVVLSKEQAVQDQQDGIFDPVNKGLTSWDRMVELKEIVAGRAAGRTREDQVTLFNNNAGQGITDVALGAKVYENARRKGVGFDWKVDGAQARDPELLTRMAGARPSTTT